jgi:hypothetical protein
VRHDKRSAPPTNHLPVRRSRRGRDDALGVPVWRRSATPSAAFHAGGTAPGNAGLRPAMSGAGEDGDDLEQRRDARKKASRIPITATRLRREPRPVRVSAAVVWQRAG